MDRINASLKSSKYVLVTSSTLNPKFLEYSFQPFHDIRTKRTCTYAARAKYMLRFPESSHSVSDSDFR